MPRSSLAASIFVIPLALGVQATPAAAHGGAYSGPGGSTGQGLADTVPPTSTPGGATRTGAGGGPGAAGGSPSRPAGGPASPPSSAPAPGTGFATPGASSATAGAPPAPDLTRWDYWWAFNRDPFLDLKDAIAAARVEVGSDDHFLGLGHGQALPRTRRPDPAVIREKVLPALLGALDEETHAPLLSGSLIAVARLGRNLPDRDRVRITQRVVKHLAHRNQEVRETAALCLGLLAEPENLARLSSLLHDTPEGRRLVRAHEVDLRTRAYAAFGLGLLGQAVPENGLRTRIVAELVRVLDGRNLATRDVKVGAMIAYGMVPLERDPGLVPGAARPSIATLEEQIEWLARRFDAATQRANSSTRHAIVRAHAPRALVRLLHSVGPVDLPASRARVSDLLCAALAPHGPYREVELGQGAILAAGALGRLGPDPADARLRAALRRAAGRGDEQTQRFALIGLGQIAGRPGPGPDALEGQEEIARYLRRELADESSPRRGWAALAVGIQGRRLRERGLALDPKTSQLLLERADDEENPEVFGAFALALGLRRDLDAWNLLLERLDALEGRDTGRGYCAVALGMLDAKDAADPILEVLREARYRPDLLRQAATGLALLKQVHAVPELVTLLTESSATATQAALCGALGRIGDRDAIDPLLALLGDERATGSARSFAAVALGLVADNERLPWNVELSRDVHYRATTETLFGSGAGVLELF